MALEITQIKLMSANAAFAASPARGPAVETTPSQALPDQPRVVTSSAPLAGDPEAHPIPNPRSERRLSPGSSLGGSSRSSSDPSGCRALLSTSCLHQLCLLQNKSPAASCPAILLSEVLQSARGLPLPGHGAGALESDDCGVIFTSH